jgi:hypothetical protein
MGYAASGEDGGDNGVNNMAYTDSDIENMKKALVGIVESLEKMSEAQLNMGKIMDKMSNLFSLMTMKPNNE